MIKILILDDDEQKIRRIIDVIQKVPEISTNDVSVSRDLIQARDACRQNLYDLLILDLRLPNRTGDEADDMGGCEFVKELSTSTTLLRPYHIIGLTAYEELFLKEEVFFQEELWRVIRFDPSSINWSRQLESKLQYLVTSKKALPKAEAARHVYDMGIITALHLPEYQSILDLPGDWEQLRQPNDPTVYNKGLFKGKNKNLSVITACAQQMGSTAASVLACKIITQFRPRYLIMTGIAAGVKDGVSNLGDILIADQSWDYESGKHVLIDGVQVFEPDPRSIPLNIDLKEQLLHLQATNQFLSDIENGWRGNKPGVALRVHIGPVASGSGVVQDERIVTHIKTYNRKLIGLDMETYGVFFAAVNSCLPRPIPLSIKSVCDFADTNKSDIQQAYAAYTSAQYMFHFALEYF